MHTKNSIAKTTTAVVAALATVALLMGVLAWAADDDAEESATDISGATLAYVVTDDSGTTTTTTDAQTYTYTGSAPDITLSVTLDGTELGEDDYEVTYYSVTVGEDGSYTVGDEALSSAPTDAGTYAISVTGTGNYTGTVSTTTTTTEDETYDETYGSTYGETEGESEATSETTYLYFTIKAVTLASVSVSDLTYTGAEQTPEYVLYDSDGTEVSLDEGYDVVYYAATTTQPESGTDGSDYYTATSGDTTYYSTGSAATTVTNAGAYLLVVTDDGNGNLDLGSTGYVACVLTVAGFDLTTDSYAALSLVNDTATYTGSAFTPEVSSVMSSIPSTLTKGTDYTISYADSTGTKIEVSAIVNAGTYTVIATGIGNYTGTLSATFTVTKADQDISYAETSVTKTYGDDAFLNTLTVTTLDTNGSATITYSSSDKSVASVDSSGKVAVRSAGTATITATASATDNYNSATTSYELTVGSLDFSGSASIELSATELTYDGTDQTPATTVTVDDEELTAGTDYTLSMTCGGTSVDEAVSVGAYTVTASGTGNYTGSVTATFTIVGASIEQASITADELTYNGSAQTSTVTVTLGEEELEKGSDYTLAYDSIVDAGDYTVTVTGCGNYTGIATGSVTVEPLEFENTTVSMTQSYTYTGEAVDLIVNYVRVSLDTDGDGVTDTTLSLSGDTDYGVTYYSCNYDSDANTMSNLTELDGAPTDANSSTDSTDYYCVAFNGTGNYTGTDGYYLFRIEAASVSNATLASNEVTYTGATPELDLTFTDSSSSELAGSGFYTVTYYTATTDAPNDTTGYSTYNDGTTTWYYSTSETTDATDVGTYIAVVTLDGTNVTGDDITVVVSVVKGDAIDGVSASDVTYTGSVVTPAFTFSTDGEETALAGGYDVAYYAATTDDTDDATYSVSLGKTTWYSTGSALSEGVVNASDYLAIVTSTNTDNVTFESGTNDYLTAKFSVTQASSTGATLALSETNYTYTGSSQVPDATVTLATGDVVPASDYEITYVNASGTTVASPTDASTYTATATFTGTNVSTDAAPTATFTITAADQTLSFSSSNVSAHVSNSSVTAPTLSGAQTTVTYASSDTSVATVNSSTGAITIVAAGTTTITASAAATTNYNTASATWTLTVTGHSWSTSPTWSWSGYTSANATFTCSNSSCTVKTQTVTATITSQTTDATYTSSGKTVYIATVTFDGTTYTDTQTVTIAQLSKLTNGLSAKAKKVKAKGKYNKKKKLKKDITIGASSYVTVSGANGTVTYALAKNVSGVKLSSGKGEITLKKKKFKKKETVKLTISITAAGDTNHNAKTVAVDVKIKLK